MLTLLMQTSNTAHFILHDYCTATDKGPVHRTFRSETAKRRQKLAGMYCVYAQKGASEAPRPRFTQSIVWAPLLYLPQAPTIPSVALYSGWLRKTSEPGVRWWYLRIVKEVERKG